MVGFIYPQIQPFTPVGSMALDAVFGSRVELKGAGAASPDVYSKSYSLG